MQVLFLALMIGQQQAPSIPPQAPLMPVKEIILPPKKTHGFFDVEQQAYRERKHIVAFVNTPIRDELVFENSIVIRDDSLDRRAGIHVYFLKGDGFDGRRWESDISANDLRRSMKEWVMPMATPFGKSIAQPDRLDADNHSSWSMMGRLAGMQRYKPATLTQSIFKYVGNPNGIIRGVPRSETEPKYQVPGGLVGVKGWRSELYRYVPDQPKQFHVMFPVRNSVGFTQYEAAFQREYPDDTEFDDVLINTKTNKVFEHRIAQKTNGRWERYVAFKDASQRPEGYQPLKSGDCQGCHNHSDRTYGNGLPSGGDEIFSDPFRDFPGHGEERQVVLR